MINDPLLFGWGVAVDVGISVGVEVDSAVADGNGVVDRIGVHEQVNSAKMKNNQIPRKIIFVKIFASK